MSTQTTTLTAAEIEAHNAEIWELVGELNTKNGKYEEAEAAAKGISGTAGSLSDGSKDIGVLLEQIKINGEAVGGDTFKIDTRNKFNNYDSLFNGIASECRGKASALDDEIAAAKSDLW